MIKHPHHPYTRALVGVSPSPDPMNDATRAARVILKGETPNAAAIPSGCRFHPRCPLVFDRCHVEEPPLFDIGGGQQAACWLAEGGKELPVFQPAAQASPLVQAPPVAQAPSVVQASPTVPPSPTVAAEAVPPTLDPSP